MAARAEWRTEWDTVPTPSYLVYEELLEKNLKILAGIAEDTGAKVLLAQKCFSMYHYYPLIGRYLSGTTASGIYEARLSQEEMGKENHVFKNASVQRRVQRVRPAVSASTPSVRRRSTQSMIRVRPARASA